MKQHKTESSQSEPVKTVKIGVNIVIPRDKGDEPESGLPYTLYDVEMFADSLRNAVESEKNCDIWYAAMNVENEKNPDCFCVTVSKGFRHKPQDEIRVQFLYRPAEYGECLYVTMFNHASNDWIFLFQTAIPANDQTETVFDMPQMQSLYQTYILPELRRRDGIE